MEHPFKTAHPNARRQPRERLLPPPSRRLQVIFDMANIACIKTALTRNALSMSIHRTQITAHFHCDLTYF
jgi:hypothetical protein